jgi:antirestriction protein ArdC
MGVVMNNYKFREEIVSKVIQTMELGREKWEQTWSTAHKYPFNPVSGIKYNRWNMMFLLFEEMEDPRWCTFKQAQSQEYTIKKGEKATPVYFYDVKHGFYNNNNNQSTAILFKNPEDFYINVAKQLGDVHKDELIKIVDNYQQKSEESDPKALYYKFIMEVARVVNEPIVYRAIPIIKEHKVFNFSQMENVPEYKLNKLDFLCNERAENILTNSGAKIMHDSFGHMNYYIPSKHEIHLVPKVLYATPEAYYATAMHELSHWTMGEGIKRSYENDALNYSEQYAREELIAELSSIFICSEIDLPYNLKNHTNYLASWVDHLKSDTNALFVALADANKVVDYIKEFDREIKLNISIQNNHETSIGLSL